MSEWFHVGQKVQCINDDWGDTAHPKLVGVVWARKGCVYTIRDMSHVKASYGSGLVLWFEEIVNPVVKFRDLEPMEVAFAARQFRPLRKRTTSIEVFKRLLITSPKEVERA